MDQVGPMKKFKNKKEMFEYFADMITETFNVTRTGQQCSSRYKTVIRRKTKAKCHNNTYGMAPTDIPFEDEIEKIKAQDDSLEPEELQDSYGVIFKKSPCVDTQASSDGSSGSGLTRSEPQDSDRMQDTQDTGSPGPTLQQETTKGNVPRVNSARSVEMKAFFDHMNALSQERAQQRAARLEEKKKYREHKEAMREQRRKERAEQHSQRMAVLNRILGMEKDEL
ncbi:hypothetical protein HPB48_021779 [Haemaphysalis longicornis]|uniref:Uncharacterized protein n=1 Tax=Haemaphysalis longicornis TaxID=44386 RepID=A0A9J6GTV8_HAELO|nr:hypothetical protein HPB48_021779 [Haemaphysalis longicornis]